MGEPARKRETEQAPAAFDAQAWLTLATAPGVPPASRRAARRMTRLDSFPYAFFSVGALAGALDCSKDTARRALRGLETRDLLDREDFFGKWKEQRSNNYQAKMPPGQGPSHTVGSVPGGRSQAASPIKRRGGEKKQKEQQSARPPERPPAPACEVVPPAAAAAPCVAPVPSVESVAPVALASIEPAKPEVPPAALPEAPRSLGVSDSVPHPTAPSQAPSRAVLDPGTAYPEPGTSIAVIVDPDDARIMELDGPRPKLAKCRPLAVEPPPALLAKVLREHGPDAGVDVAEVLRSPEARAHPRAALEALEALAAKPASQIARSAGGYYRGLLRVAIRGELRRPSSLGSGWSAMGRLQNAREAAEQREAWGEAAELREQAVEVSARARAALDALERQDRAHQGVERMIASCRTDEPAQLGGTQLAPPPVCPVAKAARMPPPRALAGPREMPAGVPRTNRALFRVPDD